MATANEGKNPFEDLFEAFRQEFRQVVREELAQVTAALGNGKNGAAPKTEWMRAEDLATIYNLPKTWFEDRGRDGDIQRTKPGRHMLFYRPDVDKYLMNHSSGGEKRN